MEEEKRKQIEAKLYQLLAQLDENKLSDRVNQAEEIGLSVKRASCGARVIRRRKGQPDLQIA